MGQVGGSWGRCMGAGVALAVLFAAGTARGEDVVVLKNGGFSRGRIIDHDPQTGTTIALPDGTSKRFDAAEVESVKRGEEAPVAEPAPEAPRTTPVQESVQPSDGDGVFRPRVRGGVSVLGGTMIVGGSGISTAVAAALGVSGRIGVKVAPEVSLFYEPSLVMGIDSGDPVFLSWQQVGADWSANHVLLAGSAGLAPLCVVRVGCAGNIFGAALRGGYLARSKAAAGGGGEAVFVGGEARTAILPGGAVWTFGLAVGWEYL